MKANEILEMKNRLDAIEKRVDNIENMFKVQIAINDSQTDINTYTENSLKSVREIMETLINGHILTKKEEKGGD